MDNELFKHAEIELNRIASKCEDEESYNLQLEINNNILDLVREFCLQEHSGTTAPYVIEYLYRLLNFKPIGPLTGEENEWKQVEGFNEYTEQNIRCSSVFRTNGDNSTAYNVSGRIFTEDGGKSWYGSKDSVIKITFPYVVPDHPEEVFITIESEK